MAKTDKHRKAEIETLRWQDAELRKSVAELKAEVSELSRLSNDYQRTIKVNEEELARVEELVRLAKEDYGSLTSDAKVQAERARLEADKAVEKLRKVQKTIILDSAQEYAAAIRAIREETAKQQVHDPTADPPPLKPNPSQPVRWTHEGQRWSDLLKRVKGRDG